MLVSTLRYLLTEDAKLNLIIALLVRYWFVKRFMMYTICNLLSIQQTFLGHMSGLLHSAYGKWEIYETGF